jgi:hypothetical protein
MHQGWAVHFPNKESDESSVDTPAVKLPVSSEMTALHVLSVCLMPVPETRDNMSPGKRRYEFRLAGRVLGWICNAPPSLRQ